MARFNTPTVGNKTVNLAGGEAYKQSPEMELASILFTSFAEDKFYQSASQTTERLKQLIKDCDKKFAAQAAIYARTVFGMRSISHIAASELARYIKAEPWAVKFFSSIIYRVDDMTEIISYHLGKKEKVSNAMKKGFAKAFDKFNKYALAKYRAQNKSVKLVDVVKLVHPKPIEKNKEALEALIKGDLKSFNTWESELTRAGQTATTEDEKTEFKKEVWINLVRERKIKYFALLRNLRNIIEQAPEILNEALQMLVDEKSIKESLVLPFRFVTAYEEIKKMSTPDNKLARATLIFLNKAIDISLNNIPKFEGETLVVIDTSSSMEQYKVFTTAALFGAVLVKTNNADLITFDYDARYVNVNILDSTLTIAGQLKAAGGSTNFHTIFRTASEKYDRVIILSDMQGWVEFTTPMGSFNIYKERYKANPFIYSFDLQGYGSMQFPEDRIFALAGFSDKIFSIMPYLEMDKNALINKIKEISL